jgi:hypothetical protein
MRSGRQFDPLRAHVHPQRGQFVQFRCQLDRVDHHPRPDQAGHMGVQDAGGDQVQAEGVAQRDHGMAGVVAAVIAGDDMDLSGQVVHDPALSFISPLSPDNDDCRHRGPPFTGHIRVLLYSTGSTTWGVTLTPQ